MVGFWLLMRDAHLWSLAHLLAFGCSDSHKSVAASPQSHLPSFLPAFPYPISATDAGLFTTCLFTWQGRVSRRIFFPLLLWALRIWANWELNGRKSQTEESGQGIDFFFSCPSEDLPQADIKCLSHSKLPLSLFTNQLAAGRAESRGRRRRVVTARDPGCTLSQACCPWSLDNHGDTSSPGDCSHYRQNFRARVQPVGACSAPLINKCHREEMGEKGGWLSLPQAEPRKGK